MTTGRTLALYNNASQTLRCEKLAKRYEETVLLVNEADAADFTSERVVLKTEFGQSAPLKVQLTDKVRPKTLFCTFHHADADINRLFGDRCDVFTLTAAFKSIKVEIVNLWKTACDTETILLKTSIDAKIVSVRRMFLEV